MRLRSRIKVHDEVEHPLQVFSESLRQTRRERRARPGPPRRSALLTIARDEPIFLPIWLRYYSRFFAPDDIYVLDHGATARSIVPSGYVWIPLQHDTVDNAWMVSTIEHHQRELLERYDVVLVAEVDEIVTPTPEWGTLDEYLAGFNEDFVNCLGYEVLHLRDREPPLDVNRPILEQRSFWFANDGYDKPLLATVPLNWTIGFHQRTDRAINFDPDLRLIHLHRVDYEICLRRHRDWRDRPWNKRDLEAGWGSHNRVADDREFERWFYEDSAFPGIPIVVERIPALWRGLF